MSNNVGIDFTELGPPYGNKSGGTPPSSTTETAWEKKMIRLFFLRYTSSELNMHRINGKDGPKPIRCAKCKRWDWEEGYLSTIEKRLRRDLLRIESVETSYPTMFGERGFNIAPSDLCASFLSIYPRPTVQELETVLNPISYLGPYNHYGFRNHGGTFTEQIDCGPGWIPIPGSYRYDKEKADEMGTKEEEIRHELMQHIIDSRWGIIHTNSTHYTYLASRKEIAKESSEFEPSKMWYAIAESKRQEDEQQGKKLEEET
ncbi:MAG: hypothetical protein M3Y53_09690 [Thermoproteota archaeon]|nr:hypothetical protein [Thermoproteota archaeon]